MALGRAFRSEAATSGPIVIFGTKWPSITSTCNTVPPPSSAAFASSASRAKFAESIEGASSMVMDSGRLLPFLREKRLYAEVLPCFAEKCDANEIPHVTRESYCAPICWRTAAPLNSTRASEQGNCNCALTSVNFGCGGIMSRMRVWPVRTIVLLCALLVFILNGGPINADSPEVPVVDAGLGSCRGFHRKRRLRQTSL